MSTPFYEQLTVNNEMSTGFQNTGTLASGGTKVTSASSQTLQVGVTVSHFAFFLKRTGSPTGTLSYKIIPYGDTTGGTDFTPDKTDLSTISTTGEWVDCIPGSHTITADDVITAWCTNASGDASNKVNVMGVAPLTITGLRWTEYNYGWDEQTTYQGGIKVYAAAASTGTRLPPPPIRLTL